MGARKVMLISTFMLFVGYIFYKVFEIPTPQIDGWVEDGFEELKKTYRSIFVLGLDKGSSFAVHYNGRLVAHLWGGCKNFMCTDIWRTDTTALMFSSTNILGGLCLAVLVDRGYLNFSKTVASYWPEFGVNGKEKITVEDLVTHRAGLVGIEPPLTLEELQAGGPVLSHRLAEQRPAWKPGSQAHFHTFTFGLYVDELFKRVDPLGRSCVHFLEREIIHPLKLDIRIGLRDSNQEKRLAQPYSFSNIRLLLRAFFTSEDSAPRRILYTFFWRQNSTYQKLMSPVGGSVFAYAFQMDKYRRISLLSTNGISTVDSLARLMGLVALSGRTPKAFPHQILSSQSVLQQIMEPISDMSWMTSNKSLSFGRGTVVIRSPANTWMIGYPGTGGQMAFADPAKKIGLAYLTNHLSPYSMADDPRYLQLQQTLYEIIRKLEAAGEISEKVP